MVPEDCPTFLLQAPSQGKHNDQCGSISSLLLKKQSSCIPVSWKALVSYLNPFFS